MREYHHPETGEEVTVVEQIQVEVCQEFSEWGIEGFEPRFGLEGGIFPEEYAIPQWLAHDVEDEMLFSPVDHGIRVIDTDEWETY